jgi:hypothetical protein
MLTEKEAWLKIAEWFKQDRYNRGIFMPNKRYYTGDGICLCIEILDENRLLHDDVTQSMHSKIEFERKGFVSYVWPLTPEGDKQRVQFCIDRAKEL